MMGFVSVTSGAGGDPHLCEGAVEKSWFNQFNQFNRPNFVSRKMVPGCESQRSCTVLLHSGGA